MDEFDHIDNRSINRVMVQLMVSMVSYGKFMLPHQSTFDMAKYLVFTQTIADLILIQLLGGQDF